LIRVIRKLWNRQLVEKDSSGLDLRHLSLERYWTQCFKKISKNTRMSLLPEWRLPIWHMYSTLATGLSLADSKTLNTTIMCVFIRSHPVLNTCILVTNMPIRFFSHLSSFVTAVQNRPIIGLNTNLRKILRQVLFVCTVAKMRTEFPLLI
jgi:hypothetical protein